MSDCICKLCREDVLPRANECCEVFVLDAEPARPARDAADRGRFALSGQLAWEIVPDGEVLVAGDGRMHEAQATGLQRYNLHALKHAPPSKRPPSQELTRPERPKRIRR